jgi:hypothetical protein
MTPSPLLALVAGCAFVAFAATTAEADCAAEIEALREPGAAASDASRPAELPANSPFADAGMAGGDARESALRRAEAALAAGDEQACMAAVELARSL